MTQASTDPAEIARIAEGLTKAQRAAVLWLPGDGSWSPTRAHWTVSNSIQWLERKRPEIAEAKIIGQNGQANDLRHRLAPKGLAVRAYLEAKP